MYFTNLPLVEYPNLENENNTIILTNILTRSSFLKEILDNTAVFYEYQIKNNETSEIIADKLYGDPNRHWIILMFNKIMNAQYEFPLNDTQLKSLIIIKYDQTIEQALTTIHHYEQKVTKTIFFNGIMQSTNENTYTINELKLNFTTGVLEQTPYLPGTADTYLDAGSSTESFNSGITVQTTYVNWAISNYTHELNENEKRRTIRLLDKDYVTAVENEFKRLMRNGN